MSQTSEIIKLLRENSKHGTPNYMFPARRILKYSSRISELRKDGYNIYCERDRLKNGRATNVFRYFLIENIKPKPKYDKSKEVDGMKYELTSSRWKKIALSKILHR